MKHSWLFFVRIMYFGSLVQALSKGAIVHHGYEKVEVKESKQLIEGKVSFRLSVDAELAPVVQVLVYCVLPSENVIAANKDFNVEKCFRNKVMLVSLCLCFHILRYLVAFNQYSYREKSLKIGRASCRERVSSPV